MASILIDTYYISGFVYCPARYSIRCVSHLESEHMVCRPPPTPFFAATKHPSLEQLAGIFRLLRNFRDNLTLQHTATFAPLSPPFQKKTGDQTLENLCFYLVPSPTRMVWRVREIRWVTSRKRSYCKTSSCAGSTLRICGRDTFVPARGVSWRWAVGDGSRS